MKIAKSKTATVICAIFLMLSMSASLAMVPTTSAASTMTTYPFIGVVPNPVGVGSRVLVHFGITEGLGAADQGYTGLTVTVTRPDNTTEELGPFRSDSTGGTSTYYVPSTVGTYYFQFHFPKQTLLYNSTRTQPAGTIMSASDSEKLALNVTQQQNPSYPNVPLPTEYWSRPIDAQATDWYNIAGNWLVEPSNRFTEGNDNSPNSPHILFTTQLATGGLVGGGAGTTNNPVSMDNGDAYEGLFAGVSARSTGQVIINGKLYYNDYKFQAANTAVEQNVVCVDLHTGEKLWVRNWNNTRLQFGQTYYWSSYNSMNTYAYLWSTNTAGTTWNAYDTLDGRWIYSMINVPTGTRLYGPNGEIYVYYVDQVHGWMMLWNSSRVISDAGSWDRSGLMGGTFNCSMYDYKTRPRNSGYEWNKTIPTGLPGLIATNIKAVFLEDRIIGSTINNLAEVYDQSPTCTVWGISLVPGQEGTLLFNTTWQKPPSMSGNQSIMWKAASEPDMVGTIWSKELRQSYGISLETGKLLWGPTESTGYLDFYEGTGLTSHFIAYGNYYEVGLDGIIYCRNVQTGKTIWAHTTPDIYHETEIGNNWWLGICFITNGKVYLCHAEHSPNMPLPRGSPFLCLNATTGELIWQIDNMQTGTGWGGLPIIGDSIIAAMDQYDQHIYAIGKGPSTISVSAPDVGVTTGNNIEIRGTVTDISPGTRDSALMMRFPNGVPAVSDASMSDWMLYVYKQFARPTNATGVPVSINVIDSNNNYRNIGTVTSDINGMFSFAWAPDIPGAYTVIASFAGSQSYYGSSSETSFVANQAPSSGPTAIVQPVSSDTTQMYVMVVGVAIIVAIAIGFAVTILMLRKRP